MNNVYWPLGSEEMSKITTPEPTIGLLSDTMYPFNPITETKAFPVKLPSSTVNKEDVCRH